VDDITITEILSAHARQTPSVMDDNVHYLVNRFRQRCQFQSKIAIFPHPSCILRLRWWGPLGIRYRHKGSKKLEWWGYQMVEKFLKDRFRSLDTIPECDGRTGHTKKCAQCVLCVQCELLLPPPTLHALANEQDHCVVRAPELEVTGSKDVPACASRSCPHLEMSNITA